MIGYGTNPAGELEQNSDEQAFDRRAGGWFMMQARQAAIDERERQHAKRRFEQPPIE